MIPKIQKDFLLLFQCIIDFGAEVLRDFTEEKIKIKYKTDNFTTFLENTKHYFYHQWDKKKVLCCECPAHGCNIRKTGKMDKKIYDKLYLYNSSMKLQRGHEKKSGSSVIQTCICRYTAKQILIKALDLSDLNALLIGLRALNTPMICHSEAVLINKIMNVRGTVCHAVTTTTFSEPELNNLWAGFTNALYSLCPGDPRNVKWLKKTIEKTKKTILSDEDVQELMGKTDMQEMMAATNKEAIKILQDQAVIQVNMVKEDIAREGLATREHFDKQLKWFVEKGTSIGNVKEGQNDCSSCKQKDIQIKKLAEINTKFKEHKWTIKRFLSQPDMEDISDDHSDYSSDYSSGIEIEELTDEEFSDNSDYITCPSSVKLESTPIQCYVESSFESSLEQLRLMMREQSLDGREKLRIQIIFKEERDMKWTSDILYSFKEENNERFSGIEFFHVSSINKG